jgi:hypothetical protein
MEKPQVMLDVCRLSYGVFDDERPFPNLDIVSVFGNFLDMRDKATKSHSPYAT